MTTSTPPKGDDATLQPYIDELVLIEQRDDEIAVGDTPSELDDLVVGSPWFSDDCLVDSARWAVDVQQRHAFDAATPFRDMLLQAFAALSANPTLGTIGDVRDTVLAGIDSAMWPKGSADPERLHDYSARIDFYLWEMGDREAASRTALFVRGRLEGISFRSPRYVRALKTLWAALYGIPSRSRPHRTLDVGDLSQATAIWVRAAKRVTRQREDEHLQAVAEDRAEYVGRRPIVKDGPPTVTVFPVFPKAERISLSGERTTASQTGARKEYESLAGVALPCIVGPDIQEAAAELRGRYPWLSDIIDSVLSGIVGRRILKLPNLLLVGSPGCGKTRFARDLAEVLHLPVTVYPVAGDTDGSFKGTNRQWATGRLSVVGQLIAQHRIANPVVVLDELEKAGTSSHNGRLTDSVIPFLELETARAIVDPYLELPLDFSAVSWFATSNSTDAVPKALLDRFRIVKVPEPSWEHLGTIVALIVDEIREERGQSVDWCPDLQPDEVELLGRSWRGGSIRPLRRAIEVLVAKRDALAPRH